MESFTAYLTSQVLWKTSCNTDFVFLCLAAASTASSSFPLRSHKKGRGLLGFMAVEQGLSIHHRRTGFSGCKTPPPAQRYRRQAGLVQSRTHRALGEPAAALRRCSAFIAAPTAGLNRQRASPREHGAKHERGLKNFCFFLLCRLDSETYHIPACGAQGLHAFKLHSW